MARHALSRDVAGAVPQSAEYASSLFAQFRQRVDKLGDDAAILDLGPSTTSNVMYWVRASHSVSALDLMAHEIDEPIQLDYEDGAFGGVLCWTVLSHLSLQQARGLMAEIARVLRPDGWLFAVFDGDGRKTPGAQRYRIIDAKVLEFEPLSDRELPRPVPTGEIEKLFNAFREVRVMVMRHGSREALGRRP